MGLFDFLTTDIGIDLGTANTLIVYDDEVVVNQPSIVAVDRMSGRIIAVGEEAQQMHEKTHEKYKTIRPLRDGVIADFTVAESMIQAMIKLLPRKGWFYPKSYRMVICVPSGITEVERRAVTDSAEHSGGKDVRLIDEPMAAAIGIGLDVKAPTGYMVVDIGGGTTEIAVIALSGIVTDQSIRIAGDEFNDDILDYMRKQHNMLIGERSAERIKIEVGAALPDLETPPEPIEIRGKDLMSGIPKTIKISHTEVAEALNKSITKIEDAVLKALESTPPELSADIYEQGIYITGGGALLRGLDKRLHIKTQLPIHVAEDPLKAVVRGTAIVLKNLDEYKYLTT
ncbi:MAG: rod shape-determining protein [Bacteroidia bacterium]